MVGNISINDVSLSEGNSGTKLATFTVSRAGGTAAFSVNYATANGSATAGSDYVAIPLTTLNFAAGETAKTVSVTINGDTTVEGNETFSLNLSNAVGPGASAPMGGAVTGFTKAYALAPGATAPILVDNGRAEVEVARLGVDPRAMIPLLLAQATAPDITC